MSNRFTQTFTAAPEHIDAMGHVNNAVWVQWMEAIATAHWMAQGRPEHVAAFAWVAVRHEIDYRGNIREGEQAFAETFIPDGPKGAKFDRRIDFRNAAGKLLVCARTTWAMIDIAGGRLVRVPPEVSAPFAPEGGWPD